MRARTKLKALKVQDGEDVIMDPKSGDHGPTDRRPRFRNQTASFEEFESIWNAVSSHVEVLDNRPISVNSDCPRVNPGSSQIKSSISSQS